MGNIVAILGYLAFIWALLLLVIVFTGSHEGPASRTAVVLAVIAVLAGSVIFFRVRRYLNRQQEVED